MARKKAVEDEIGPAVDLPAIELEAVDLPEVTGQAKPCPTFTLTAGTDFAMAAIIAVRNVAVARGEVERLKYLEPLVREFELWQP